MNKGSLNDTSNKYKYTNWDFLQGRAEDKSVLQSVLKFHYKTLNREIDDIYNFEENIDTKSWISTVEFRDVLPNSYEEIIDLEVPQHKQLHSYYDFNSETPVGMETLGQILYDAFGREAPHSSKRYPSAGALYPVIPLLIVLHSDKKNNSLNPGCYVFDSTNPRLYKITQWTPKDIVKVNKLIGSNSNKMYAPHCIAYAIDIRRAITKYQAKGYRHALIEVGLMVQSFRESLQQQNNLGERCWSAFSDMPLTHICGLNVRLCPIVLIQWFGFSNLKSN
ncbi:hypothetical protein JUJ52_18300 [Virgibacillus sp. AGTR]|uniref:hypothetical protein n=1 Tax=Virgibacillus sp. AGTR TaxID=2812055 RepID=UPI001D16A935|nr:hypothetical protein [Virgibacillus sp. AGTR]MCC2251895.1 hypothetical protein [Virgibacillus sp. AGTR]